MSGQRKLVVDKLAEEEAERKVKGEAKKEKQMVVLNFKLTDFNVIQSSIVNLFVSSVIVTLKSCIVILLLVTVGRKGAYQTCYLLGFT